MGTFPKLFRHIWHLIVYFVPTSTIYAYHVSTTLICKRYVHICVSQNRWSRRHFIS